MFSALILQQLNKGGGENSPAAKMLLALGILVAKLMSFLWKGMWHPLGALA